MCNVILIKLWYVNVHDEILGMYHLVLINVPLKVVLQFVS